MILELFFYHKFYCLHIVLLPHNSYYFPVQQLIIVSSIDFDTTAEF